MEFRYNVTTQRKVLEMYFRIRKIFMIVHLSCRLFIYANLLHSNSISQTQNSAKLFLINYWTKKTWIIRANRKGNLRLTPFFSYSRTIETTRQLKNWYGKHWRCEKNKGTYELQDVLKQFSTSFTFSFQ